MNLYFALEAALEMMQNEGLEAIFAATHAIVLRPRPA